jgi:hypothetical protein
MAITMQSVPIIVDLEASGFGSDSYPIEVGVITDTGKKYCRLIQRQPEWQHWSQEAEDLHGISREILKEKGFGPAQICDELNQLLDGKTIYSDGWVVDYPWMITLFNAAKVSMGFRLSPLESILSESQMDVWHQTKTILISQSDTARHRASTDAELIQQVYISTHQAKKLKSSSAIF